MFISLCGQTVPAADAAEESTKAAVEQVKASPHNATIGEVRVARFVSSVSDASLDSTQMHSDTMHSTGWKVCT